MKDVKKIAAFVGKILLAVASILSFLCAVFFVGTYFIGGLSYENHTAGLERQIAWFFVACACILLLLAAAAVCFFKKGVKKPLTVVAAVLLAVCIPLSAYAALIGFARCITLGPYGCSYTEDIANYEKHTYPPFPESITDDMTVISFAYYYKYFDKTHTDCYLEVKFADAAALESYVAQAKAFFGEENVISYPNPYNADYTDVVNEKHANCIRFRSSGNYRFVEMYYRCISYSYKDLTVIYSSTSIGDEIEVGNDPDRGEYYPKYLERFGVEWDPDNSFQAKSATE